MNLLLDTHVVLRWLAEDPALPSEVTDVVVDGSNRALVSVVSIWEIAIKQAAGRLEAPDNLLEALEANSFEVLPITAVHALRAGGLPRHHGDPFDRMLIAQAQVAGFTLVSVDRRFRDYDVALLPS